MFHPRCENTAHATQPPDAGLCVAKHSWCGFKDIAMQFNQVRMCINLRFFLADITELLIVFIRV